MGQADSSASPAPTAGPAAPARPAPRKSDADDSADAVTQGTPAPAGPIDPRLLAQLLPPAMQAGPVGASPAAAGTAAPLAGAALPPSTAAALAAVADVSARTLPADTRPSIMVAPQMTAATPHGVPTPSADAVFGMATGVLPRPGAAHLGAPSLATATAPPAPEVPVTVTAVTTAPTAAAPVPTLPGGGLTALNDLGAQMQAAVAQATPPASAPAATAASPAVTATATAALQTAASPSALAPTVRSASTGERRSSDSPSDGASTSSFASLLGHAADTPSGSPSASSPGGVPLGSASRELARLAAQEYEAKRPLPPGGSTVELRLDPPELGSIYLRMVEDKGQIHAHVTVSNPEVRHALANELSHLSSHLAQHGVSLGSMTVGDHGSYRDPNAQQSDADSVAVPQAPASVAAPPATASSAASRAAPGRVNLRA